MKRNIQLLIIDPQFDFCDPTGALYVKGAEHDMTRLAALISRAKGYIDDIRVTLDSHQPVHIAHPICWVDNKGNHPAPFTIIKEEDVLGTNPKWRAYNPAWQERQVNYVKALKAGGRYELCIWPPHCLIGTDGHRVHPILQPALREWQDQFALIDYVTKGSNPFTEHYSVVKADVLDPEDLEGTDVNTKFVERLEIADEIWASGQALSHCLANSVEDISGIFGDEHVKKFVLLEDCTSPVWSPDAGVTAYFQSLADNFIKKLVAKGMRVAKSTDL